MQYFQLQTQCPILVCSSTQLFIKLLTIIIFNKFMKGHWFNKKPSKYHTLNYSQAQTTNSFEDQPGDKPFEAVDSSSHMKWIKKLRTKMEGQVEKLKGMEEYYNKDWRQKDSQITLKCWKHDQDLVVYCKNDSQLLCSHCAYTDQTHKNHQVKEIKLCLQNIANDNINFKIKSQQFLNKAKTCQRKWQDFKYHLYEIKSKILTQLQTLYDQQTKLLSKKYLRLKQELTNYCQPYQESIQSIKSVYSAFRKIGSPERYPFPMMKHVWSFFTISLFSSHSFQTFQFKEKSMFKSFQNHMKQIIKKMVK